MNEIQNQIYFYQCLKNVFFGISIFCLFVTLWIAYGRKRSEKLKGILVITVFLFVGACFRAESRSICSGRENSYA